MAGTDFVTLETFRARFPQFTTASAPDATVQIYIDDAVDMFDVCRWGELLGEGSAFYVAWALVWNNPASDSTAPAGSRVNNGGSTSTVISKKAGDLQKQNAASLIQMMIDNPYLSNKYGQRYWWLMGLVGTGAVTV